MFVYKVRQKAFFLANQTIVGGCGGRFCDKVFW